MIRKDSTVNIFKIDDRFVIGELLLMDRGLWNISGQIMQSPWTYCEIPGDIRVMMCASCGLGQDRARE